MAEPLRCTAFAGETKIASGSLADMVLAVKALLVSEPKAAILVFDDATGQVVDLDLRGSDADALARLEEHPLQARSRGPGRPKLGVVSREVTLLPRHWDWLNAQRGGASVALRKLIDEARRSTGEHDRARQAQEAAYRFASAMAGNEAGYEEAMRSLFAADHARFMAETANWPSDIRSYVSRLAENAFPLAKDEEEN